MHVEPTEVVKKRLKDLELEKMKHLNSIMIPRENEPPCLEKGDINEVWCYKTIETVAFGEVDAFEKQPNQSYMVGDSLFNQLTV